MINSLQMRFQATNTPSINFLLECMPSAFGNTITFTTPESTGNHKLALVYTEGDVRAYLDGSQVGTTNTTSWGDFTSNQLDSIYVGAAHFGGSKFNNWVRAFAFYKRALTDSEAKILTQ